MKLLLIKAGTVLDTPRGPVSVLKNCLTRKRYAFSGYVIVEDKNCARFMIGAEVLTRPEITIL